MEHHLKSADPLVAFDRAIGEVIGRYVPTIVFFVVDLETSNGLMPLLFILYTRKMFELVENRLFFYADDSTLLAVVRKPADRPAVVASVNRDLARIQEWCNHSCKILNHNKTKALVVSRSFIVSPVTWSCLGFLSELVPSLA